MYCTVALFCKQFIYFEYQGNYFQALRTLWTFYVEGRVLGVSFGTVFLDSLFTRYVDECGKRHPSFKRPLEQTEGAKYLISPGRLFEALHKGVAGSSQVEDSKVPMTFIFKQTLLTGTELRILTVTLLIFIITFTIFVGFVLISSFDFFIEHYYFFKLYFLMTSSFLCFRTDFKKENLEK